MSAPTVSTVRTLPSSSSNILHIRADDCPSKYHPSFSFPDADVVLRSFQGTLYRVHSFTLRTTSGLFATMFSLPQPRNLLSPEGDSRTLGKQTTQASILDVYEDDFPLEHLLKLMSGLSTPKLESLDNFEQVLRIAEKWDTPGPLSTLRHSLTAKKFLDQDPLRCYSLAKHFGWSAEAKAASTHTLVLNLHDPIHTPIMDQMSSKDLLCLLDLHRKRRDLFRELLDSPERFAAGNSSPYHCNRCGVTVLDNYPWRQYKHVLFLEMERRPLGDTLGTVVGDTAEWPEALACWEAKCSKEGCGGLNYDRIATLRQIRACVALLPLTVDD
ncbi:hypothetical protein BDN70DRAFT_874419 [Pholiota conissans]|uniref:BTB domain-containing protein n=1 Tax=Pholiota conissans TaxID=109636 RepID=A0A9P5Z7F7_9AGAR|nr:hypothetical protein BDN70DRAFT_874419 [Pholiota conissans]